MNPWLFPTATHRRLAPLLAASLFGGVALWVPIEKLFLSQIGFTHQTVGIMAAAYAALVPVLEVPSGILADRWSRRGVLVIGNAGAAASVLIGGLSTNVTTYVLAAMLLGVYFAMQSGTFDAVVYDTVLEETGSSGQFESMIGRIRVAESISLVTGALLGGLLAAATTPRVTYFATLPFLAISTLFLLAFREPRLHEDGERHSLRQHIALTLGTFRADTRLLPVAGLMLLTALLTQAVFEFGPLWLVDAGAGTGSFGPAWAALMASLGLGGVLAARVQIERPTSVATIAALLAAGSTALVVPTPVVATTVAQFMVTTLAVAIGIAATKRLHDAVSSDVRSGVASTIGAATWIVFLPFALGFGAISQRLGIHAAGWMLAAVAAATTTLLVAVTAATRRVARPVELAIDTPCEPLAA